MPDPAVTLLDLEENEEYFALPIPSIRDQQISDFLRTWLTITPADRERVSLSMNTSRRWALLAYSERIATLAVRKSSRELILYGLLALGVDGWLGDWRDNAVLLSLHYDAAKKVGVNSVDVFEQAAELLPSNAAAALRSFTRRDPADQTLEAMGYKESIDAGGFKYERTW